MKRHFGGIVGHSFQSNYVRPKGRTLQIEAAFRSL
jgi:hypothetical protein